MTQIKNLDIKMKEIKEMKNDELKIELKSINYHIKHFSYGRWELSYRNELEKEAEKRGIEI
jgi:hypothetical protein